MARRPSGPLLWGALAAAALLAVSLGTRTMEDRQDSWGVPSVYNGHASGLQFMFEALRDAGVKVAPWTRRYTDLDGRTNLLTAVSPRGQALAEADVNGLLAWLHDGGTLLYIVDMDAPRPYDAALLSLLGLRIVTDEQPALWRRFIQTQAITITMPHPVMDGVIRLNLAPRQGCMLLGSGDWAPLAGDDEAVRMWVRRWGAGTVFVVDDCSLAANATVHKPDNLRFLLNMVRQYAKDAPTAFAEYYHQPDRSRSLAGVMAAEGAAIPLLQFGLGLLVLALAAALRFGDPSPLPRRDAATASGHLAAIARMTSGGRGRSTAALVRLRCAALADRLGLAEADQSPRRLRERLEPLGRAEHLAPAVGSLRDILSRLDKGVALNGDDLLTTVRACRVIEQQRFLRRR